MVLRKTLKSLIAVALTSMVFISNVFAETAPAAGAHPKSLSQGLMGMLPMLIIFIAIFYFLLIRPQTKRAKEHKKLMNDIAVGDEVLTTGGMIGKISEFKENFIKISIAKGVDIMVQRNAIASVLPKGTMDTL